MLRILLFITSLIGFLASTMAQEANNPCVQGQEFHVAVIGSSTAAGSGPMYSDSTWVNRYRAYLQSINPNNQVTNLAIGGTTTYHIMPDWFTAPVGRPASNPNNNISQAIALGADAIIVNMPSNDTGNGFGTNEQMGNFHTLFNHGDSLGIPVWVCTTQPRNYGPAQIQIQVEVRDSILAAFGPYAIDFWSQIALPNSTIDPQYDSGDGVHLNDAGHGILWSRVVQAQILANIVDTFLMPEHALLALSYANNLACGDTALQIQGQIVNLGMNGGYTLPITNELWLNGALLATTSDSVVGGVNSCQFSAYTFSINTLAEGNYQVRSYLTTLGDSIQTNDTSTWLSLDALGYPTLAAQNDTICPQNMGNPAAIAAPQDEVRWYDAPTNGNFLGNGSSITTPSLSATQTFYAEAIRGNLYYTDYVATTQTSNINWNGTMFNIVAHDSIVLDSLVSKIEDIGLQGVTAYYHNGSYLGNENNAAVWNLWGNTSVNVTTAGDFYGLNFGTLPISQGDTIGIYLHMTNNAARISYRSVPAPQSHSTSEMEVITGSGVSYTFGTTFYPRDWNGEVHYHHGSKPDGDCKTNLIPVDVEVLTNPINLGNDTTLLNNAVLTLNAPAGMSLYWWNGQSGGTTFTVDSATFGIGTHVIQLVAIDAYGCNWSDSIVVTITSDVGMNDAEIELLWNIYPNPIVSGNALQLELPLNRVFALRILNSIGQEVSSPKIVQANETVPVALPSGIYFVELLDVASQRTSRKTLVVE